MSGPVPCPSCGQPVPLGRLACPTCGALVASVSRAEPEVVAEEPAAEPAAIVVEAAPSIPELELDDAPAPEPGAGAMPELGAGGVPEAAPEAQPQPPTAWSPAPRRVDETLAADGIASGGVVPGSYLPPSTVHRPGSVPPVGGSMSPPPAAPGGPATWAPPSSSPTAGGWIRPTPGAVGSAAPGASGGAPSLAPAPPAANTRDARPPVPGQASILADLPFDAPDELEGWLVALGGGLGVLGFFLPWTGAIAEGLEGYLGSWGLGVASRLPVFLLLVVVTALALLPNRVAPWVRTGVLGMVTGGILFGLVWLYLGSDASQLGALLAAVGAVLLIAGGIIAVAPGRSANRREDA